MSKNSSYQDLQRIDADAEPERVACLHPDPTKEAPSLDRRVYEATKAAIMAAVPTTGPGLIAAGLRDEVAARTPDWLWSSTSVGWATTVVKLDLLARGLIRRVPTEGMPRLLRRP